MSATRKRTTLWNTSITEKVAMLLLTMSILLTKHSIILVIFRRTNILQMEDRCQRSMWSAGIFVFVVVDRSRIPISCTFENKISYTSSYNDFKNYFRYFLFQSFIFYSGTIGVNTCDVKEIFKLLGDNGVDEVDSSSSSDSDY